MRDISKKLTVINTGKKESEAGAASQPSGAVYVGTGGGGGGGNLNGYLLKSIWDKVWEIRTDSQGTEYIYGKLPVVLQYGLTMYSGDGVDIPSIYEGLPIDNDTIYWKDGILKAKAGTEGAITEITSSMVTSALGYTPYDASNPNGYITSAALSNYALSSDVEAVSTKLNDFLEGSDTDNIINKWKELETFLSGLSQSDNLATILGNKAEKTDLAKYIPIAGTTDITGEKNFIGGLKINGSPIYYDTEKKYWKLEGDVLITGGLTMYGTDSDFVPSTIMDAILYDDSTLGINANGELYVKGGTGSVSGDYLPLVGGTLYGALNLADNVWNGVGSNSAIGSISGYRGQLSIKSISNNNPGIAFFNSSATHLGSLQCSEGVLYWRDNIVLHANNYSSYALPLSGGTIDGQLKVNTSLDYPFIVKRNSANASYIAFENINGYLGDIGFLSDGSLYAYVNGSNKTIWHSGNDGSGSGLDADLLDGVHLMGASGGFGIMQALPRGYTTANQFFGNGNIVIFDPAPTDVTGWGAHSTVLSLGHRETRNHQLIFTIYGGSYMPRYRRNIDGVWSEARTFAFLDDNVASATRIQAYTNDSGDKVLLSGTRSDNTYERCIYDNGWGLMLKRGLTNTSGYIATLNDNVASATKSTYSRYIGNVGRDGTTWYDTEYPIYFQWGGADGNSLYIKCSNYPIVSPQATKLETARTIWGQSFDGTGNVSGKFSFDSNHYITTDTSGIYLYNSISNTYIELYDNKNIILNGGDVGIGTSQPSAKLHIEGVVFANMNTESSPAFKWNKGGSYWGGIGYNGIRNCNEFGSVNADNTWANADTDTWKFRGNILATGGVTMYSDIRKKTKLKDVVLSLQQIANAPLIEHYYNSDQNKTTHVGSIAQYWAEMNDWFCKKDSEGYYTMEIQNAALASAISVARELVKFETETDRRIRLLEKENKRLKDEVEQLKLNIA